MPQLKGIGEPFQKRLDQRGVYVEISGINCLSKWFARFFLPRKPCVEERFLHPGRWNYIEWRGIQVV